MLTKTKLAVRADGEYVVMRVVDSHGNDHSHHIRWDEAENFARAMFDASQQARTVANFPRNPNGSKPWPPPMETK